MLHTKELVLFTAFLFLVIPELLSAGEVELPNTGQTTCYDESGNVIPCLGTGQDGDIQAGVEWPEPRFEDNGDGTVTDLLTGLIWLRVANCAGYMSWNQALNFCNNLSSGSYGLEDGSIAGDWRLPSVIELESLVDAENYDPCLPNGHPFINVQSGYFWSATTYAYSTNSARVLIPTLF